MAHRAAKVKVSAPSNSATAKTMGVLFASRDARYHEFSAASFSQLRMVTSDRVKSTTIVFAVATLVGADVFTFAAR